MIRIVLILALLVSAAHAAPPITFKKTVLDTKFRSEGVAIGDFNHDGKQDIAVSDAYYAAPDWKMHPINEQPREYEPIKYSNSFNNFAEDLNGDGWTDLIVVDFPGKETWWLENPKGQSRPWPRHVLTPVTNNESPQFRDVDGDGVRELIFGFSSDPKNVDGPEKQMGIARRGKDPLQPWTIEAISAKDVEGARKFSHGLGVGDIDGDGRRDVIVPHGWWEAPAKPSDSPWIFHPEKFGAAAADMYAFDIDGDGDNDVLSTAAHQLGMWWHEKTADGYKQHEISTLFSQTHAVCLADINGDGLMDFVTGKRWWAHGPKGDVDPGAPALLYWFELQRKDGKPAWIPHPIDNDSGVGTQFEVGDINGDKLLDVAVANKKGVFVFEQQRDE
ncbi:MAG: VCBS repeat-containing protein [Planctomycetaceae bacterium]|nr:VCBS repeat-containing protein [Planctomycetaceae bacterium]